MAKKKSLASGSGGLDRKTGLYIVEAEFILGSGWNVRAEIDVSGAPEIIRLELIRQDHPTAGLRTGNVQPVRLTGEMLRSLNLSEVMEFANNFLKLESARGRLPPRALLRRSDTDARYAIIAAYYVEAHRVGSRSPRADAARQLRMTSDAVRDALHEARRRGLLTDPPEPRQAGGELTQKATEILKELS